MSFRGRDPDMARMSLGLARAGMDLRHWVSYGTVAAITGEDGGPSYTDPGAVVISPSGVDVDVVLEPSGYPVTCRWGLQAGDVSILAPIRPGDQVLVLIPDGDVSMIPEIVRVISGASAPLPVEDDGKPVFRNDRLSIFARGVPVEIRTDGGGFIRVNADGTVQLGGADAEQQALLGTAFRDAQAAMNSSDTGLSQAFDLLQASAVGPLAALKPGFILAKAAVDLFEARAAEFLSSFVKLK